MSVAVAFVRGAPDGAGDAPGPPPPNRPRNPSTRTRTVLPDFTSPDVAVLLEEPPEGPAQALVVLDNEEMHRAPPTGRP